MKKIYAFIAAFFLLSLAACGESGEERKAALPLPAQDDYTEYDFPDYGEMSEFSNLLQYADMQSYCGWYYCYGSTDGELSYMVYDPYSGAYRGNSDPIMYIQKDEWQPSNLYEMAACFKVPRAGRVSVELNLELIYEQGDGDDGVSFYCLTSFDNKTAFYSAYLVGSRPAASEKTKLTVEAGEVLYFVMSANEGRYNDLTRVELKISYGE